MSGNKREPDPEDQAEDPPWEFGSHEVRLSMREWSVAAVIVLLIMVVTPPIWNMLEPVEVRADYRQPYALSEDYWQYQRAVEKMLADDQIILLGDSVIWGEYTRPDESLAQHLNDVVGSRKFTNGGLNGMRQQSLEGLVRRCFDDVKNRKIIVQCNLLWLSSPQRDLQKEDPTLAHRALLRQFEFSSSDSLPWVAMEPTGFVAPFSERMGTVIDRFVPYRSWVTHLRTRFFDSQDLAQWTRHHPYDNPLGQISLSPAVPRTELRHKSIAWNHDRKGNSDVADLLDFPWIDLKTSNQWLAFRRAISEFQSRGADVFVIVGPLNEHMLEVTSRKKYQRVVRDVTEWLMTKNIPHHRAALLPSRLYADASHPLSSGYRMMAEQVFNDPAFRQWLD